MVLVPAPHQVQQGGGDLEVQLVDWAILLLDMGSVRCRDHQFGVTGSVLVKLKRVPARHMARGCS